MLREFKRLSGIHEKGDGLGAKTEPSCSPRLPNSENCQMVNKPAHCSPEILIQCGQISWKLVTLAGALGDPYD